MSHLIKSKEKKYNLDTGTATIPSKYLKAMDQPVDKKFKGETS